MTAPAVVRLTDQVAEEVRALLGRRRISASMLARRMGVTQRYISRRLTGEAPFDLNDLELIAGTLGVSVSSLLPATGGDAPMSAIRTGAYVPSRPHRVSVTRTSQTPTRRPNLRRHPAGVAA